MGIKQMTHYDFDSIVNRKNTYSTQWDYIEDRFGEKDLLPFSVSDTDFRAPKSVIDSILQRTSHEIFGYSRWNHSTFKQSICHWYQARAHAVIEPDWILYSPAVCYSISLLLQLKSSSEDEVLVLSPMYDAFYQVILQNKRKLIQHPLQLQNGHYTIDFTQLENQLKTAKIFLLTNPHNPTGRVFLPEELKQITYLCEKYHVFLISDDIHMDIVYRSHNYTPVLSVANDISNCCICTSMSKTMNTPGLIGSYLMIPDTDLRSEFLRLLKGRDALSSVSIFGMHALIASYNEAADYVDQLVVYLEENMELISDFLGEHLPFLHFTKPEGTYLAWIDARECRLSDDEIQKKLVRIGKVGIMPGKTYGQEGFLRMNAGCPKKKLIDGLERLKISFEK